MGKKIGVGHSFKDKNLQEENEKLRQENKTLKENKEKLLAEIEILKVANQEQTSDNNIIN